MVISFDFKKKMNKLGEKNYTQGQGPKTSVIRTKF